MAIFRGVVQEQVLLIPTLIVVPIPDDIKAARQAARDAIV